MFQSILQEENAFHLNHGSWSIRDLLDTRLCHQKFDRNNQKPFWAYLPILAPTAPISMVLRGSGRWMGLMDLAFHRHDSASAASHWWGERAPNPRRLLSLPPSQSTSWIFTASSHKIKWLFETGQKSLTRDRGTWNTICQLNLCSWMA